MYRWGVQGSWLCFMCICGLGARLCAKTAVMCMSAGFMRAKTAVMCMSSGRRVHVHVLAQGRVVG